MFGLFKNSFDDKLEKVREKHQKKLAQIQLENELKIEENRLKNQLELQELRFESSQMETKAEIFKLKNDTNKDARTIRAGRLLNMFALVIALISTLVTIAGGYSFFDKSIFTLIVFSLAIVVLQMSIYVVCTQETRIKEQFHRHYKIVLLIKWGLLLISMKSNYDFFIEKGSSFIGCLMILILCVCLDVLMITLASLANDQRTLTFSKKENRPPKFNRNLVYKLICNILNRPIYAIESKYYANQQKIINLGKENAIELQEVANNKKVLKSKNSSKICSKTLKRFKNKKVFRTLSAVNVEQTKKRNFSVLKPSKYEKVLKFILANYKPNEHIKSFQKDFKLSTNDYREIRKQLTENGIISTVGKKTYRKAELKLLAGK